MDDKQVVKSYIEEMTNTSGWKLVEQWMKEQEVAAVKRLLTIDPDDIGKVYEYQYTVKNYRKLVAYINELKK